MNAFKIIIVFVALAGLGIWMMQVFSQRDETLRFNQLLTQYENSDDHLEAARQFTQLAREARSSEVRQRARESADAHLHDYLMDPGLGFETVTRRYEQLAASEDFDVPESLRARIDDQLRAGRSMIETRRRMDEHEPQYEAEYQRITEQLVEAGRWSEAIEALRQLADSRYLRASLHQRASVSLAHALARRAESDDLSPEQRLNLIREVRQLEFDFDIDPSPLTEEHQQLVPPIN
ncbi:MAG: hypothetical protein JJU36_01745 [Phycisphaeraceae bacterium]|nr:hypothetical protein [Phycisphaeraceae bacterium]